MEQLKSKWGYRLSGLILAVLISGCGNVVQIGGGKELIQREVLDNQQVADVQELFLTTGVGTLRLKPSADEYVHLEVVKKARGKDEVTREELLDGIQVDWVQEAGRLMIQAKTKDNQDLWEWKNQGYKDVELVIDFNIEVPSTVKTFQLESGVGEVNVSKLRGAFEVTTGVGNTKLEDVALDGKSQVHTGTGKSVIYIAEWNETSELQANAGVGDIELAIPKDARYNMDFEAFLEKPSKGPVNGGGGVLMARAGVGKITITER